MNTNIKGVRRQVPLFHCKMARGGAWNKDSKIHLGWTRVDRYPDGSVILVLIDDANDKERVISCEAPEDTGLKPRKHCVFIPDHGEFKDLHEDLYNAGIVLRPFATHEVDGMVLKECLLFIDHPDFDAMDSQIVRDIKTVVKQWKKEKKELKEHERNQRKDARAHAKGKPGRFWRNLAKEVKKEKKLMKKTNKKAEA